VEVGYFGHLTDAWFDWDLILSLAEQNEDFYFHIIGFGESDDARRTISKCQSIKLYGKVPPQKIFQYAKDWDVAIIPFMKGNLSQATDPIKTYEYLYFGLPVVTQGIDHLGSLPYVKNCSERKEFHESLRTFTEKKRSGFISYRTIQEFLRGCLWEKRFTSLLTFSEEEKI
jgi:hypothetical protein